MSESNEVLRLKYDNMAVIARKGRASLFHMSCGILEVKSKFTVLLLRLLPLFIREGRKTKHENYRSHKHQGTCKPEVMQGFRTQKKQRKESAYRGYVPHKKRIHDVLQCPACIRLMLEMVNIMKRIINGYSYDYRTYPEHDYRY